MEEEGGRRWGWNKREVAEEDGGRWRAGRRDWIRSGEEESEEEDEVAEEKGGRGGKKEKE